jgi:hypothetical protein
MGGLSIHREDEPTVYSQVRQKSMGRSAWAEPRKGGQVQGLTTRVYLWVPYICYVQCVTRCRTAYGIKLSVPRWRGGGGFCSDAAASSRCQALVVIPSNVLVHWLADIICIREITGSNLGSVTGCPDKRFLCLPQSSVVLKRGNDRSHPHPLQFTIHIYSTIWHGNKCVFSFLRFKINSFYTPFSLGLSWDSKLLEHSLRGLKLWNEFVFHNCHEELRMKNTFRCSGPPWPEGTQAGSVLEINQLLHRNPAHCSENQLNVFTPSGSDARKMTFNGKLT